MDLTNNNEVEYDLKIVDEPGQPFVIIAEWVGEEGEWRSSIPINRKSVELSNFDVIGHSIRELEARIRHRTSGARVVQRKLELPPGWASHKGPDAMIKRIANRTIMTITRRAEEHSNEQKQ